MYTSGSLVDVEKYFQDFPKPEGVSFSYGTAGFRTRGKFLPSTVYRMGILASLRAIQTGKSIGLMITASHNPEEDNGIKLSDPEGDMLYMLWENYANNLANVKFKGDFQNVVDGICKDEGISTPPKPVLVLLARDTRPSGEALMEAAKKGVQSVQGVEFLDLSLLTTPQLHWLVKFRNNGSYPAEDAYFNTLQSGLRRLLSLHSHGRQKLSDWEPLLVDGAFGVGALKLAKLAPLVRELGLELEIRNSPDRGGILNSEVGADFVQKEKRAPLNFKTLRDEGRRCVSVDGDADRLVYFYFESDESSAIRLLDGDKIASLAASFLSEQLQVLSPLLTSQNGEDNCSFGVVQTAYANGASSRYIEGVLGLKGVQSKTGVKYLHMLASGFDCGLYFEANGHGTILFKPGFLARLTELKQSQQLSEVQSMAADTILALSLMMNQCVGDALSGILLVESILLARNWSIQKWDAIYTDLPSRQLKVSVWDRSMVETTHDETRVLEPGGLQAAIDAAVERRVGARSFVRPSGTENVVRVYAEAGSQEDADSLANEVAACVITALSIL